jgi:hypothetical protein
MKQEVQLAERPLRGGLATSSAMTRPSLNRSVRRRLSGGVYFRCRSNWDIHNRTTSSLQNFDRLRSSQPCRPEKAPGSAGEGLQMAAWQLSNRVCVPDGSFNKQLSSYTNPHVRLWEVFNWRAMSNGHAFVQQRPWLFFRKSPPIQTGGPMRRRPFAGRLHRRQDDGACDLNLPGTHRHHAKELYATIPSGTAVPRQEYQAGNVSMFSIPTMK